MCEICRVTYETLEEADENHKNLIPYILEKFHAEHELIIHMVTP